MRPQHLEQSLAPAASPQLTPLWVLKAIWFVGVGANSSLFRFITVFYHSVGLDNAQIGLLQLVNPWVTFCGSFAWASVCDRFGAYKRVLVATNVLGAAVVCCLLIPAVSGHFAGIVVCMVVGPSFLASRAGVTDALTLKVTAEYEAAEAERRASAGPRHGEEEGRGAEPAAAGSLKQSYGRQRLWGAAGYGGFGLVSGLLSDAFGDGSMFVCFGACLGATVLIISTQLPADKGVRRQAASAAATQGSFASVFCRFEVAWFFANLVVYGIHMALVESFLFVYLKRDFPTANSTLLGLSVATMCLFELPVFYYIQELINRFPLTALLTVCHAIFAVRVLAYSLLPRAQPWLVLLIEPLHGITMAAMWSCSVEFGRRLAPEGSRARMQALASGVYYRAASGAGSLLWGMLTRPAPEGHGFRAMYRLACVSILLWSALWNIGWRLRACTAGGARALAGVGPAAA